MRNWQRDAPLCIEQATKDLSADATLTERRSALRKAAFDFHGGTSWGKKVWSKHVRKYLEFHGLPKRNPETAAANRDTIKLRAG
jgi:hypothetical protein